MPFYRNPNSFERVLRYISFRKDMLLGKICENTKSTKILWISSFLNQGWNDFVFSAIIKNPITPYSLLKEMIEIYYVSTTNHLKEIRQHPNYHKTLESLIANALRKVDRHHMQDEMELRIIDEGVRSGRDWNSIVGEVNSMNVSDHIIRRYDK